MTQQPDDQNVSQKRDQSSTDQDTPVDSNLNDLVGKSRQATREADEALRNARQGDQPVQQKGQGNTQQNTTNREAKQQSDADAQNPAVSSGSDRAAPADNIGNPDAAQGSSSDSVSAP